MTVHLAHRVLQRSRYNAFIPLRSGFGVSAQWAILVRTLHIFHFHDYFDGLIGFETLRDLDAYFDIGKNMLKIGKKEYQLKKKYPDYQTINNTDKVHFIKIETKSKNDLVVGEETGCGPYYILLGIYSSDGTSALVAVKNNNNMDPQTNFNELHLHEEEFVV